VHGGVVIVAGTATVGAHVCVRVGKSIHLFFFWGSNSVPLTLLLKWTSARIVSERPRLWGTPFDYSHLDRRKKGSAEKV
jgi:hypothetical protein